MFYELNQHKTRDAILWVIVFVLIAALAVGLCVALLRTTDGVATLNSTAYSRGVIGADGEQDVSKKCIFTKHYIKTDGLKIELVEKADVQYKLFYYKDSKDGKKEFISATEWLTADFDGEIAEGAQYVRIVIDPISDEAISLFEIRGYANQLTVTYQK